MLTRRDVTTLPSSSRPRHLLDCAAGVVVFRIQLEGLRVVLDRLRTVALRAKRFAQAVVGVRGLGEELDVEAEALMTNYEQRFPGIKATDLGISMDPAIAADTMRGWKP